MPTHDITAYGAAGDGVTNDAAALQRAVDACHAAGGGTVLVPAGRVFRTGTVTLRSHVELHVERGAVLAASPEVRDYPVPVHTSALSGGAEPGSRPDIVLIWADGAECVAVTGGGVIDGGGRHFVAQEHGRIHDMAAVRPFTVYLRDCDRVTVRDVQLRDGAYWTLRLSGCRDVLVHGITIRNDTRLPNNDGIDVDTCARVRISDCDIVTGDDAICVKTCWESARLPACEDVIVTGCSLVSASSAICIGSEVHRPVRNVVVTSCVITANRGLAVQLSGPADVTDVSFSDIVIEAHLHDERWWGRGEPVFVCVSSFRGPAGALRNMRVRNVLARSENGVVVTADGPGRIDGLLLDGVRVELDRWTDLPGGRWDLRPNAADATVEHPTAGFHIEQAAGVTLRDCEVVWAQEERHRPAYFRQALVVHQAPDLRVAGFRGGDAHSDAFPAGFANDSLVSY